MVVGTDRHLAGGGVPACRLARLAITSLTFMLNCRAAAGPPHVEKHVPMPPVEDLVRDPDDQTRVHCRRADLDMVAAEDGVGIASACQKERHPLPSIYGLAALMSILPNRSELALSAL